MESNRNAPDTDRPTHYRPHLIIVFAIAMAWFAANVSADEFLPAPIAADNLVFSPSDQNASLLAPMDSLQLDATSAIPAGDPALWSRIGNRPVSVELTSSLANFDADAQPDGWRASLVLRDVDGNPVIMRSNATFTLVPRVPLADHQRYIEADDSSLTWSMSLRFNEQGVANFNLPLRRSLQPSFGWSSGIAPFPLDRATSRSRNNGRYRGGNIAISRVYSGRNRRTVGGISYTRLDVPRTGAMRVRVSVPTEGVFESETQVWLRPQSLLSDRMPGAW